MDFSHSEDRQMLADSLGRYLGERYSMETRHLISASEAGWCRKQWAALAELGVVGALFDEAVGGYGGQGFDIAVVFEQLGRALVIEPFLGTLMAGRALALAGGHQALIEQVIAGSTMMAFAHDEPNTRYALTGISTRAEPSDAGWVLHGAKAVISQLAAADWIVVSARISSGNGDRTGLFLVAKDAGGVSVRDYSTIDGGHAGELTLTNVLATMICGDARDILEQATAAGIVALCWEAVGAMDVLKRDTLEYLRTRKQFGVAIGKFQALQHRMATAALEIEQARSAAINASAALEGPRLGRERATSAAKFTIGRVGALVSEEAIQMHGGIGMTAELPLSHYAKRVIMIDHQLGDEDHHLERYASLQPEAQAE
ncbi:Acyl-CoA dehydrogenase [Sphingobium sp. AP50]|uniref:acyl-CoA dehydrogenase family protein n=1 Tax=Sphingobium sp. AP50 TaxID=1884369 RepID=UPI0008B9A138|nr:acyl-CoA dehydrogenase family protein [Sphingobium sp. AP50]SEK05695.1 Acyl-CoA dehydrogenase [Sphingobium sp. AP50]